MVKLAVLLAFALSVVTFGAAAPRPLPLEAPEGTVFDTSCWCHVAVGKVKRDASTWGEINAGSEDKVKAKRATAEWDYGSVLDAVTEKVKRDVSVEDA